jgi:hypothetical protein
MRGTAKLCVLALGLFVLPSLANAYDRSDVQELLDSCGAPEESPRWSFCSGFISGISEQMALMGVLLSNSNGEVNAELSTMAMCAPAPMPTLGTRIQAFTAWARKHSDRSSDPNFMGVITAMRESWPCKPPSTARPRKRPK